MFFFSSRRRHTRLTCDWSSDVCSSDLEEFRVDERGAGQRATGEHLGLEGLYDLVDQKRPTIKDRERYPDVECQRSEIGRASCRERVEISVVGGSRAENRDNA